MIVWATRLCSYVSEPQEHEQTSASPTSAVVVEVWNANAWPKETTSLRTLTVFELQLRSQGGLPLALHAPSRTRWPRRSRTSRSYGFTKISDRASRSPLRAPRVRCCTRGVFQYKVRIQQFEGMYSILFVVQRVDSTSGPHTRLGRSRTQRGSVLTISNVADRGDTSALPGRPRCTF